MRSAAIAAVLVTSSIGLAEVGGRPSPAETAIVQAQAAIRKDAARHEGYNALALAMARRARETGDPSFYDRAGQALQTSLKLLPDNFEARKLEAWLLLGKHEFASALKLAKELNKRSADDWMVYGFIADASAELGNYKEAEEAAQWMLDLSRSNVPALTRAAYLREIFGDIDGAVELMTSAYGKIDPTQVEDRAWVLTQLAHLRILAGQIELADKLLAEALRLFPGYHYALANLAKVRMAQRSHGEAVDLLRQRYTAAPHPENLFDLAVALERAGRRSQALQSFREFETAASRETEGADNSNRELILYYADHAAKPAAALAVARREIGRRRDVHTLDAYAWALYRNGRTAEARREIEAALQVGVRDPMIFYHAGAIAARQGDHRAARGYFDQSLRMNGRSEVSPHVRAMLRRLPERASAQRAK